MSFSKLRQTFWSSYDASRARSFIAELIDGRLKQRPIGQGTHFTCYPLAMGNMQFAIKSSHISLNDQTILAAKGKQWVRDLQLLEKRQITGIPPFDLYTLKGHFIFVMPLGKPIESNKDASSFTLPVLGEYTLKDTPQFLLWRDIHFLCDLSDISKGGISPFA